MKNILVIGCYGQLGRKIQDNKELLSDANFEFVDMDTIDISKIEDLTKFLELKKFDIVINCAAYTAVDKAEDEEENAVAGNVVAPKNLAICAKKFGYKLIHVSTDYVFDGKANTPYSEDMPTNPVSMYGRTKRDGELAIISESCDYVIVRTAWLYSEYGNNFVKTMIKLGSENRLKGVVYDQVGSPTYAGDLAKALLSIAKKYIETSEWHSGIYHFTNRGVCSWFDFTVNIFKIKQIQIPVKPLLSNEFPSKAQRPNYSVLNTSKISETFDIEIPYWTDALKEMLEKYN